MNARQENKLSMAKTVQTTLTESADKVNSTTAFATAKTSLDTTIAEVDALVQKQAVQFGGSAADKKLAAAKAIDAAMEIIGPAKSYATEKENNTLLQQLNYSKSGLRDMRDSVLANVLTLIKDTVNGIINELKDYGVTTDQVAALETAITNYNTVMGKPQANKNVKATATKQLNGTFKKLTSILKRLDGFAENKKSSEPEFYLRYVQARKIVDNKGGGKGDEGGGSTPPPVN